MKVKGELKRAHHILKQLKKRLNANKKYTDESVMSTCDLEYQQVMQQIQDCLGLQSTSKSGMKMNSTNPNTQIEVPDSELQT